MSQNCKKIKNIANKSIHFSRSFPKSISLITNLMFLFFPLFSIAQHNYHCIDLLGTSGEASVKTAAPPLSPLPLAMEQAWMVYQRAIDSKSFLAGVDLSQFPNIKKYVFKKEAAILSEGLDVQGVYLIVSGTVRVSMVLGPSEHPHDLWVFYLNKGEYFGQEALAFPHSADTESPFTFTAVTPATVLFISKNTMLNFLDSNPESYQYLFQTHLKRELEYREALSRVAAHSYPAVRSVLLKFAQANENGEQVTPRMTHADIAALTGRSREMVTKVLADLKEGNYIKVENSRIFILKKLPERW